MLYEFNIGTIRAIKEWQICVTMIHGTNNHHLLFIFCFFFFFFCFVNLWNFWQKKLSNRHYLHINNLFARSIIIFMAAALPWTSLLIYSIIGDEMSDSKHDTNPIMSTGCCDNISGTQFNNIFFNLLTENFPRRNSKENLQTWHRTGITEFIFWT